MFTRIVALSLLVALLSSGFSRFFVYAGFEFNHNYIAQNLCINKNRPWLHCNGKCFFMKKVKQAEENEKKQTAKDNLSRLEVSFFQQVFRWDLNRQPTITSGKTVFPPYIDQYCNRDIESIRKPPKFVS